MLLLFSVYWKEEEKKKPHKIKKSFVIRIISTALTYPLGMSESSLLPGSFSTCCLILSSRPEASAPWYWSTRTLFRKNRNVGVAEMLLAAAVPFETRHTNNVKPRKKKTRVKAERDMVKIFSKGNSLILRCFHIYSVYSVLWIQSWVFLRVWFVWAGEIIANTFICTKTTGPRMSSSKLSLVCSECRDKTAGSEQNMPCVLGCKKVCELINWATKQKLHQWTEKWCESAPWAFRGHLLGVL